MQAPRRLFALAPCVWLLVFLFFPGRLCSQDPSGPSVSSSIAPADSATSQQVKKFNLSGTVVNSVTGEGVPRALVDLSSQMATMTDGSGRFTFEVPAGGYVVTARRPGYFEDRELRERTQYVLQTVQVGPSTPAVTVKLIPESIIFGHVTDPDGLPVARLPVESLRSDVIEGRRWWVTAGTVRTDEDGYFRIARLLPGTYRVVAGPSRTPSLGAIAKIGTPMAGYGEAYYPAPAEDGSKSGVVIDAGRKIEANLSVKAERFYEVSGVLLGASGKNAYVELQSTVGARSFRGAGMGMGAPFMPAEGGSFTLRFVPPGDYVLVGNGQVDAKQLQARLPIHVSGDITDVHMVLSPAITLPVNYQVQRTKPESTPIPRTMEVNGHHVPAVPAQAMLRSVTMPQQQFGAGPYPPDFTQVAFGNLEPGKYQLNVSAFADLYVASARYGTTDLLQDELALSGAPQSPLEIVLRDDGGRISGKLTGDYRPQNVTVVVVPEHGSPYVTYVNGSSENSEQFAIANVRPGSYSLLVFDNVSGLEYGDREALDSYMSHAAHADVTANGETTVSVDVIRRREGGE